MAALSITEKLFCKIFAESHDARSSAARAGVVARQAVPLPMDTASSPTLQNAEATAFALLERADIRREISRWEKLRRTREAELQAGIRRLAFGSVTDAVRLLLSEDTPTADELERMDLFNVSEIKRPKGGGLEIKFFDRLKALELLAAHSGEEDGALGGFLKALSSK
jgi:hypothetical protein